MPAPALPFVDRALAARIEAVEAVQFTEMAALVAQRAPAIGAAALPVGGGVAAFFGRNLSLSRATGLGMEGPVSLAEVEAMEAFYRSRGTAAQIFVSPLADPSLFAHLGARGFVLDCLPTILMLPRDREASRPAMPPGVEVTVAGPGDASRWVAASLAGFGVDRDPTAPLRTALFEAGFALSGVTYHFAFVGGALAGTAALRIDGPTAYLFAASTLPDQRGRGAQAALIAARVAAARDAGCDLVFTGTLAGSSSQRNFQRAGFLPVYAQAFLVKRFDDPA